MIQGHFLKVMENMKGLAGGNLRSALSELCPVDDGGEKGCGCIAARHVVHHAILLAVSGGIDSMCMADLFHKSYGAESIALAHCNFRLRADESDGDEALVRSWASERGIAFHCTSFDTSAYASEHGISIEMAARELRYSWFASLCLEHGYAAVAVAHNANDNAETLILNLVRGTGLRGISGMSEVSPMPCASGEGLLLLRPLLGFTRKQIEGHVFAHKVPYRNDSTNAMSEYKRNSIRNEVFPLLEKMNPSFVRTFNKEMAWFSDAEEIVSDWCSQAALSVVTTSEGGIEINLGSLLGYRQWRYLLYHILEPYGFTGPVLSFVEDLVMSGRTVSGKRFHSRTHVLFAGRGLLQVRPFDCTANSDAEIMVHGPGKYSLDGVQFLVEEFARPSDFVLRQPSGTLIFDAGKLKFPFVCRKWLHGDWMVPMGMRGKKKLSDLFTDLKLDSAAKGRAVVLSESSDDMQKKQHVAGVLGMRTGDMYKVTSATERIIRVSVTL